MEKTFFRCPRGNVELLEEMVSTRLHPELSLQMRLWSGTKELKELGSMESNLFYTFYRLFPKPELIPLDSFMMLSQRSLGIMKY